jgi:hypothetical protein
MKIPHVVIILLLCITVVMQTREICSTIRSIAIAKAAAAAVGSEPLMIMPRGPFDHVESSPTPTPNDHL